MSTPRVTVLLPVYNSARTLQSSLDSVLRQSLSDFELLAIDDGSKDESPAILRACLDPRLRVLRNETNLGLMRSLNRGLREARGTLIARQDSDDLSQPDRLALEIEFLDRHPEVALVGSSCWRMDNAGRVLGANDLPTTHLGLRWASLVDNPFIHTAVVFRREVVLDELGGYDEAWPICEDYELWNRVAAKHRVANLPQRLVFYRDNPTSMMQSQPEAASRAMRRLLAANVASIFPGRAFTDDELDLLSLFRLRFPAPRLEPLLELLDALRVEFVRRHPEADTSADFHAARCRQHLRLGYKFLGSERGAAAARIGAALAASPAEWFRQAATALRCAMGNTPPLPA